MNPGIFEILRNNYEVATLLGSEPCRVYPYSIAPDKTRTPYATYGVYNGLPENTTDQPPVIDNLGTQINIWATSVKSCEEVLAAIRDALEANCFAHMTAFSSADIDPETKLFTARMDFDVWVQR